MLLSDIEKCFGTCIIGDQYIDIAAADGSADGGQLIQTAGHTNGTGDTFEFRQVQSDDGV